MSKKKKALIVILIIVLINLFIYAHIWTKTYNIIQSSYDNYGVLPDDTNYLISEDDYSKLSERVDLTTESEVDLSTDQIVYGKDYTEHYSYKISSEYGFLFFMVVNYYDNYYPINATGDYYPAAYGDRPCTIVWVLTIKGWKVVDFYYVS